MKFLLILLTALLAPQLSAQELATRDRPDLSGNLQVDPASVLQFLGSRCQVNRELKSTADTLRLLELLELLEPFTSLPLETPFTAYSYREDSEAMYDLGSGRLSARSTVTLLGSDPYFVLFQDDLSPTLLRCMPITGHITLLSGCALHLPLPLSADY